MEFLPIIEFLGKCEEISFFLREESFTILIQFSTLNFSHMDLRTKEVNNVSKEFFSS